MSGALYDVIGRGYTASRRADPILAAAIWTALGDAQTVLNVGAGAGAYEPPDRDVVAVEPSAVMIAQRPPHAARVVQADAERLPFPEDSFDVAIAVLSDRHWHDRSARLRELRRVARKRVVLFNASPDEASRFWLTRDYLPGFLDLISERYRTPGAWLTETSQALGDLQQIPVPIPHDCGDGFYGAFWRRPAAYLDPAVRAAISVFARLPPDHTRHGLQRLHDDLASGRCDHANQNLLQQTELHLGYYVFSADL